MNYSKVFQVMLLSKHQLQQPKKLEKQIHALFLKKTDGVIAGKLNLRDALGVMKDEGMLKFKDPSEERFDEGVRLDSLQLFNFEEGNVLRSPSMESSDAFYVCEPLLRGARIPVVIEGVRQVVGQLEAVNAVKPEAWKSNKIERFGRFLYALKDLQTDLIADELASATGEDYKTARKRVVEWKNMDAEMEEIEQGSQKLRSVLERALIRTNKDGALAREGGTPESVVSPVAYNIPKHQEV